MDLRERDLIGWKMENMKASIKICKFTEFCLGKFAYWHFDFDRTIYWKWLKADLYTAKINISKYWKIGFDRIIIKFDVENSFIDFPG